MYSDNNDNGRVLMVLLDGGCFFWDNTYSVWPRENVYAAFCIPLLQWVVVHNNIVNIGFFVDKELAEWPTRWQSNKDRTGHRICNLWTEVKTIMLWPSFPSARKYTKYIWQTQKDNAECLDRFLDGNPERQKRIIVWFLLKFHHVDKCCQNQNL